MPTRKPLKIVVLGGGTAGPPLSRVALEYTDNVVSVAPGSDNGGDSGDLRTEHGVLAPGDVRRFLGAHGDESTRRMLEIRYPFNPGAKLSGKVTGNILVAGYEQEFGRRRGIQLLARDLKIRGSVNFASLVSTHLVAELEGGEVVHGETTIDTRPKEDDRPIIRVWLDPDPVANPKVLEAIEEADIIMLAPGDLYTSLGAILLVGLIPEAIRRSPARVVYFVSLMTKKQETHGYTAETYIQKLEEFGVRPHAVVYNTKEPPKRLLRLYAAEYSYPVRMGERIKKRLTTAGVEIIEGDFLNRKALESELIRHDASRAVKAVLEWIKQDELAA